ncbi:ERCC4 domain-containing protein [Methanobrevibacter sp.]
MKLQIDNRESNTRINSAKQFFEDNYTIETNNYPVGDFIFENRVCFEYKTADDMISSIIDGRIFRQAEKMKQYPFSYIIIVGDVAGTINKRTRNYWNRRNNVKQFTVRNYLGALARLNIESHVIHVDNNQQAWVLMDFLVKKLLDTNPRVKGVDKPLVTLSDPVATFLSCIYVNGNQRIGIKTAVMIREYLHLEKLEDLLAVSYDDLVNVKGVGKKTARSIMEVLK